MLSNYLIPLLHLDIYIRSIFKELPENSVDSMVKPVNPRKVSFWDENQPKLEIKKKRIKFH